MGIAAVLAVSSGPDIAVRRFRRERLDLARAAAYARLGWQSGAPHPQMFMIAVAGMKPSQSNKIDLPTGTRQIIFGSDDP